MLLNVVFTGGNDSIFVYVNIYLNILFQDDDKHQTSNYIKNKKLQSYFIK